MASYVESVIEMQQELASISQTAADTVASLVAVACWLVQLMATSTTLRSLDDRLSHVGAQWRNGQDALASTAPFVAAPTPSVILLAGELRFFHVNRNLVQRQTTQNDAQNANRH